MDINSDCEHYTESLWSFHKDKYTKKMKDKLWDKSLIYVNSSLETFS